MRIIDTHVHLGDCRMCEYDNSETEVLRVLEENGVSTALLQPFPNPRDVQKVHERISELSRKNPGKVYGIISVNPHCEAQAYRNRVRNILEDGGFVAIKLHTLGHAIVPDSKDAHTLYEIAGELNLPVMVHTGLTNFGEPALVVGPALRYPKVKFILAHCGWGGHAAQAIAAAKVSNNIYLETSWISIEDKLAAISSLGPERVMLGSDTLLNMGVEIYQYQSLLKMGKISASDLHWVFHGVAEQVFGLAPGSGRA
jgi:predicted TIM-barrel fold metal-dependent hydrolase